MDEDSLKLSIDTYNVQLQQVEDALQAAGDNEDLQKLKSDLQELIKLTSDSLLSLKKSQLLSAIDSQTDTNQEPSSSSPFMPQPEGNEQNSTALVKSASTASLEDIHDSLDEIAGTKCSAPYSTEWGGTTYHNAMVVCAERIDESSEPQVRVLFCNPTSSAMLPCQYFLDGSCKFDETKCRYSHGYVVDVSDLEKYEEPDYSNLKMAAKCMARYEDDGLWYKGTVVEISDNHEEIKVLFDQYGNTETVDLHHVIPLDHSDDSDSDNEEDQNVIPLNERGSDEENDFILNTQLLNPIKTTDALGEWEKHTKGFGSKIMAKMGYVTGQGLGKEGEGRAEPVPIHLIPQGKSLDQIMELKEKAGDANLYNVIKKGKINHIKIEKKAAKAYNASTSKPKSSNVFDIINKKLGHKKGNLKDLIQPHHQNRKTKTEKVHITEKDLHKKSEKDINIQLLKTSEEMRNVEREISRLETSRKRNEGTDRVAFNQISMKIESLKKYLNQLKGSEASMTSHKKNRKDKKKMTVF